MNRDFLEAYNRELALLYEGAKEFAEDYPGIAERLGGLTQDNLDPAVAGLLEGAAFMAARVQLKLDTEFETFTSELLDQLLPNFMAPTPSAILVPVSYTHLDVYKRQEYGWTVQIRGVQSGGEVTNLPVHNFDTGDGSTDMKCPTEFAISDRREGELSKSGLISLIHRKNTDRAAFIGAQTLYRPKKYQDEQATASDNVSSRLPYIFAVSRFSHYLKCMVRDMIGSNKERDQLQRELQQWISGYVHGSPANASERDKALLPLAAAKVEVIADEENPGYYVGKFFLRPHFQLEGMDIGMSLVSKLPGAK